METYNLSHVVRSMISIGLFSVDGLCFKKLGEKPETDVCLRASSSIAACLPVTSFQASLTSHLLTEVLLYAT